MNIGKQQAKVFDEVYTPPKATEALIKQIPPYVRTIWCPCDTLESNIVNDLASSGYEVIYSHVDNGQDFFDYEPKIPYDMIITNPPYSNKDEFIDRCITLDKPWALLLPLDAMCSKGRYELYKDNPVGVITLASRLNFTGGKGNWFYSVWICSWPEIGGCWIQNE